MMLRKQLLATALLFFCAAPPLALAQDIPAPPPDEAAKAFQAMFNKGPQEEDVYRNDRLLVTATGSQKPVHLAPSVASVITADDIQAMGATTLDEALETVPGLHVEPSGRSWLSSIWSIRGIHTSINPQVLLLVNGVPFTSNYTGARYLGFQMPVAMISRIEVVRGPGSALHGADAFAGVVNVITKDNFEIDGSQAGVRYGSFDTVDSWAQHGGQYGGWDLALGVEWQKTLGDDDRIIDKDYLHAINQAAKSKAPGPLDTWRELLDSHLNLRRQDWNLHLYGALQNSAYGGATGAQTIAYGSDADNKSLLADLSYHNDHQFADWELNGRLSYSFIGVDSVIHYYPPAFRNQIGEPMYDMTDGGLEASAIYKGFSGHQLRLGTGAKNADFEPDQYKNFNLPAALGYKQCVPAADVYSDHLTHITDPDCRFMPSANRQLWYGLVQDEWQFARAWALTAGLRHDEYSDFGGTTNPRAALVWETTPALTAKLMYGQAFRAPSFSELYVTNNPLAIANPDTTPEEIATYELAFDYQPTQDLRLLLNLFTYEATDLIEVVNTRYGNARGQRGEGFEIEMDWQVLETVRLRGNFAYQRSENTETDALVTDAPGHQLYLNPSWAFRPDWSLDGQFTLVGGRPRAEADPRHDIDDYELVNLVLRKKNIARHWEAAVSVRNLFDEDARIPSPYAPPTTLPIPPPAGWGAFVPGDYPMEGRALWGEISCHF